ncbi:hypothetical protein AAMO2058_000019100 [Amorphochlora amoebiformis]
MGSDLVPVLVPAVLSATVYFLIFEILRGYFTQFFAPRYKDSDKGSYPNPGIFHWLPGTLSISEDEVLKKSGMDAAVYLRFVRMCVTATFILTILSLLLLVPVFGTGENELTGIESISLSNVNQKSDRLWAPAILMWIFTGIVCWLVHVNYLQVQQMRFKAMRTGGKIAHYTVMITQIPDHFDTEAKIRDFMEPQYPDSISHVEPVHDLSVLDTKIKELQSGEVALMKVKTKSETRSLEDGPLMTRNKCGGCCGDEVEAVKYYTEKVENLKKEIGELKEGKFCNAAFVTFKSLAVAVKASSTNIHPHETWVVTNATNPKDVLWENLCYAPDARERDARQLSMNSTIAALVVFWAVPMAFGGALANLQQLGEDYEFLSGIESLPRRLVLIIQSFGPTVWRVVLMILLQPILRGLIYRTGVTEGNKLERMFMSTYYVFLLVNIYFITLVSSSIFQTIEDIISKPLSIFELLGGAVPRVAVEMIQYILLQGFSVGTQTIVRLPGLVMTIFFSKMASVEYERQKAMQPPNFEYGANLSFGMLVLTICMCYMAVAPLILPFGVVYFSMDFLVQKYNLLHVHTPDFQTYGAFWPRLARSALNGLVLAQVALMGILGLKFGYWQQLVLWPLPIGTYLFSSHLDATLGDMIMETRLPLANAVDFDKARSAAKVKNFLDECHDRKIWVQPCASIDVQDSLKPVPPPPHLEGADIEEKSGFDTKANARTPLLVADAKDPKAYNKGSEI